MSPSGNFPRLASQSQLPGPLDGAGGFARARPGPRPGVLGPQAGGRASAAAAAAAAAAIRGNQPKTKEEAAVAGERKSTADSSHPRSAQLGTIGTKSLRQNPFSSGRPSKAAPLLTSGSAEQRGSSSPHFWGISLFPSCCSAGAQRPPPGPREQRRSSAGTPLKGLTRISWFTLNFGMKPRLTPGKQCSL